MQPVSVFIISFLALFFLFSEDMLSMIRSIRQWLEEDIRRRVRERVSEDEWNVLEEELNREFAD